MYIRDPTGTSTLVVRKTNADCVLFNPHWPCEPASPWTAVFEGTVHRVLLQRQRMPNKLRCRGHTVSVKSASLTSKIPKKYMGSVSFVVGFMAKLIISSIREDYFLLSRLLPFSLESFVVVRTVRIQRGKKSVLYIKIVPLTHTQFLAYLDSV